MPTKRVPSNNRAKRSSREIRSDLAKLKRAGIIRKSVDIRKVNITDYRKRQTRKFSDIIEGKSIAIRAPKKTREQYAGIFEQRGTFIVKPREHKGERFFIQKKGKKAGLIISEKPMRNGDWREIFLPFKATSIEQVGNRLKSDPTLDGLKDDDEQFSFTLFGHNTIDRMGFADASEMGDYILNRYAHLFRRNDVIPAMTFVSFKGFAAPLSDGPKTYGPKLGRLDAEGRNSGRRKGYYEKERTRVQSAKRAKRRAKESDQERSNRLEKQRVRSQQNRLEKMRQSAREISREYKGTK